MCVCEKEMCRGIRDAGQCVRVHGIVDTGVCVCLCVYAFACVCVKYS